VIGSIEMGQNRSFKTGIGFQLANTNALPLPFCKTKFPGIYSAVTISPLRENISSFRAV
jgi:hypothetical protein